MDVTTVQGEMVVLVAVEAAQMQEYIHHTQVDWASKARDTMDFGPMPRMAVT